MQAGGVNDAISYEADESCPPLVALSVGLQGVLLAVAPLVARIFAVFVDFVAITCPVKVYGADPTLPYAFLPTLDLSDIREVDYDFLPDASHFLQLEHPDICAATLHDFLEEQGCL